MVGEVGNHDKLLPPTFLHPQHNFSTLLKVFHLIDSMNEKPAEIGIRSFNLYYVAFMYDKTEINVHHRHENDKLYINIEKIIEKI